MDPVEKHGKMLNFMMLNLHQFHAKIMSAHNVFNSSHCRILLFIYHHPQ